MLDAKVKLGYVLLTTGEREGLSLGQTAAPYFTQRWRNSDEWYLAQYSTEGSVHG
jgi:hypothetical protein